ncbi:MAG TPA: GAF domain-containing protein, partial [Anaerolineaceae bacterium]|nr:GAF domain-containing protein [Anaerolineaceae bacterium]
MMLFIQQVFLLLTTNPGNLAYHLLLAFAIAAALQTAITQTTGNPNRKRLVFGFGLLLLVRLALFIMAALAWQNILQPRIIPPIDRGVTLISLILVIWLYVFPERLPFADFATALLGLLVLIFSVLTVIWWQGQDQTLAYNAFWGETIGQWIAIALAVLGISTLLIRRPENWGVALGILGTLLVGHLLDWFIPTQNSDFPGAVRLSQMIAYSQILISLPQMLSLSSLATTRDHAESGDENPSLPSPQFLQGIIEMARETSPEKIGPEMVQAVAQLTGADVCLLLSVENDQTQLALKAGFNRTKDKTIEPMSLEGFLAPNLLNALKRNRPLRLPDVSTGADLPQLCEVLNTQRVGHLLAVPFPENDANSILGLALISPYTNRTWSSEDQILLVNTCALLAPFLHRGDQPVAPSNEVDSLRLSLENTQLQVEQIHGENAELLRQLETTRQQHVQEHDRAESLAAMIAAQEASLHATAQPEAGTQQLEEQTVSSPQGLAEEKEHLEAELRLALEEIARL